MNATAARFFIAASLITGFGLPAWAADPVVTWSFDSPGYLSPGILVASCTVQAPPGGELLSLIWRPNLPANWTLSMTSGDGAPEYRGVGEEIVFTGIPLTTNGTVTFSYVVLVPAGETNIRTVQPSAEFQLGNEINPRELPAATVIISLNHFYALTLTIVSTHGTANPVAGVYTNFEDTVLTNGVTQPVAAGGTQFVCTGWAMTGNDPVRGGGLSVTMTLTNDATLTWLWSTNYLLNASSDPHGSVTGSTNGWYVAGSNVTVTGVPAFGYHFVGWTGNVTGPINAAEQTMTMNQARTVVAHFDPIFVDVMAPVDLGSSAHFTILAGSAISSTGGGTNNGDVGLSPTTGAAITGLSTTQVNGIIYAVDTAGPAGSVSNSVLLTAAKGDLTTAYNDAAGRSVDRITLTDDENLGGLTLAPGLYWSPSSLQITGDLILDASGDPNAVWIFQMPASTLTTAAGPGNSRVILAGGAQARNIFWQVGSSATIGTFSVFKGTILAHDSITMNTSCTVEGRALACNAAVTFNGHSIGLPTPEAPRFTYIARTASNSVTVVLSTTPYFFLTLETCPDLIFTNWTTIATDTPDSRLWTNTDYTVTATVTQRYYRAFITTY